MRRIKLFSLMLAAMIGCSSPVASAETITVVADQWCPYNCGENDPAPGYMIELVRAILKKSDIDVVYKVMPWAQALEETRRGKYDAVVGANRGDAPDFIFPSVVQGISIYQAWVREDSEWVYKDTSSLDGLRVGVVAGYSYGKAIDPYLKKREKTDPERIRMVSTDNAIEVNIRELLEGRIDVMLEDKNVMEYYFASRDLPMAVKAVGNPVDLNHYDDTYIFVAFSPRHPKARHYAELLTQGMQQMRASGELKAILARYDMDGSYRFLGKPQKNQ